MNFNDFFHLVTITLFSKNQFTEISLILKSNFLPMQYLRTRKNGPTLVLGPILTINYNFCLSKLIAAYLLI